jgi:ABC-2 type transport system ATP-binding protein
MRRRLGLAAVLLGRPQILILDEPANGLDPAGVRWLRGLLQHFAASGGTVLLSSHMLDETARIADDIVLINHGLLVAAAPLHTLIRPAAGTAAQPEQSLEDVFFQLTEGNRR